MAQYLVNLNNEPNQSFSFDAGEQVVDMSLRTTTEGFLYCDIAVDGVGLFAGRTCCNQMPLLLNDILVGNLYFEDLYGNEDPRYEEFNSRFVLVYDTEYKRLK